MYNKADHGTPFSQTTGSTTGNAVATQATQGTLVANYITDASGSSTDVNARILIKDNATIIWQDTIAGNKGSAVAVTYNFMTPLKGSAGSAISVTVELPSGAGTATANVAGFFL